MWSLSWKLSFVTLNYLFVVFWSTNFFLLCPDGRTVVLTGDLGPVWVPSSLISLGPCGVRTTPGDSRIDVLKDTGDVWPSPSTDLLCGSLTNFDVRFLEKKCRRRFTLRPTGGRFRNVGQDSSTSRTTDGPVLSHLQSVSTWVLFGVTVTVSWFYVGLVYGGRDDQGGFWRTGKGPPRPSSGCHIGNDEADSPNNHRRTLVKWGGSINHDLGFLCLPLIQPDQG